MHTHALFAARIVAQTDRCALCDGHPGKASIFQHGQSDQFAGHAAQPVKDWLGDVGHTGPAEKAKPQCRKPQRQGVIALITRLPDIAEAGQFTQLAMSAGDRHVELACNGRDLEALRVFHHQFEDGQ